MKFQTVKAIDVTQIWMEMTPTDNFNVLSAKTALTLTPSGKAVSIVTFLTAISAILASREKEPSVWSVWLQSKSQLMENLAWTAQLSLAAKFAITMGPTPSASSVLLT